MGRLYNSVTRTFAATAGRFIERHFLRMEYLLKVGYESEILVTCAAGCVRRCCIKLFESSKILFHPRWNTSVIVRAAAIPDRL